LTHLKIKTGETSVIPIFHVHNSVYSIIIVHLFTIDRTTIRDTPIDWKLIFLKETLTPRNKKIAFTFKILDTDILAFFFFRIYYIYYTFCYSDRNAFLALSETNSYIKLYANLCMYTLVKFSWL